MPQRYLAKPSIFWEKKEDFSHGHVYVKNDIKAISFPDIYWENYTDSFKGIEKSVIQRLLIYNPCKDIQNVSCFKK